MATIKLKKGEGRTIKAGGAWIFDNEIDTVAGSFEPGDMVTVHDFDGYVLGKGGFSHLARKAYFTMRDLSYCGDGYDNAVCGRDIMKKCLSLPLAARSIFLHVFSDQFIL